MLAIRNAAAPDVDSLDYQRRLSYWASGGQLRSDAGRSDDFPDATDPTAGVLHQRGAWPDSGSG